MQKILAVILVGGTLAISASAALADDSVNGYSDKLAVSGASVIAQAQEPNPVDPPAIKKFTQYRDDNMDSHEGASGGF
jgi:hypothetical protein